MPLPKRLARFNLLVTNRVLGPLARRAPGFAIVSHVGRRSGRAYRTPVNLFRSGDRYVIALTYGADSQWVRNVLAAGAVDIETRGQRLHLVDPEVVHDAQRSLVPEPVRHVLRLANVTDFMLVRPARLEPTNPGDRERVRLILNVIWFVLAGVWMAIAYAIAALICFVLIITIPFGIASLRIAMFALWPFGKTIVKRPDAGIASGIGNVIWFIVCGWWLAIGHLITGVLLGLTIIGIPLGLANFKLIPVSLLPMGREIVSIEQARAQGLAATVAIATDPSAERS